MKRILASCFGLGRLPLAPGTWGSLPPVIIFVLLRTSGTSTTTVSVIMAVMALIACGVCVLCAPAVIAVTGKTDPQEVVADEFAGQALTFLISAIASSNQIWLVAAGGFLLFRFFDIVKPWPIRKIEKLPKGWGVLANDLLAGIYAGTTLLLALEFVGCRACALS